MQGGSAGAHPLDWIIEIALRVIDITEHRVIACAAERTDRCAQVRIEAMPTLGIAVVPHVVAGQANEDGVCGNELNACARCPDILVIVAETIREILAEAIVFQTRRSHAYEELLGDRR